MITHDLRLTFNEREKETYTLLCSGLSNNDMARELSISEPTVRLRLRNIYKKLGVEAENDTDKQNTRLRAILYSGTKIEQNITLKNNERMYTTEEIKVAAKKIRGLNVEDLISFLEMMV